MRGYCDRFKLTGLQRMESRLTCLSGAYVTLSRSSIPLLPSIFVLTHFFYLENLQLLHLMFVCPSFTLSLSKSHLKLCIRGSTVVSNHIGLCHGAADVAPSEQVCAGTQPPSCSRNACFASTPPICSSGISSGEPSKRFRSGLRQGRSSGLCRGAADPSLNSHRVGDSLGNGLGLRLARTAVGPGRRRDHPIRIVLVLIF